MSNGLVFQPILSLGIHNERLSVVSSIANLHLLLYRKGETGNSRVRKHALNIRRGAKSLFSYLFERGHPISKMNENRSTDMDW